MAKATKRCKHFKEMILKFQVSPWPEGVASYLTSDLDMERGVHNA